MNTTLVYDFPTRVFHWLFALLFVLAFTIGSTVDDESALFSVHMITGLVLCLLVILRTAWGFFGTTYARFSGFALNPADLLRYFKAVFSGEKFNRPGHNPASSWAALLMMALTLGLGTTGCLMATGAGGEELGELHELMANGFLVVVLLHLAGIALHSLRHRDGIWKSMLSGRKSWISPVETPIHAYRGVGILLLAIIVGFSAYLTRSFDAASRNLELFGLRLHLGEAEEGPQENEPEEHRHDSPRNEIDDDDDD